MLGRLLAALVFAALAVWPQSSSPELPPGVLLGARIRERVKQEFAHVPEYTCLETLERFHKPAGNKAVERRLDTVRLEVLFAGNQEFFDLPGGRNFEISDPSRFIARGMIGSGLFASHVKNIFVDGNGLLHYLGEEDPGGRRAAHFEFRVPSLQGDYVVSVPGASAKVGLAGEFWADPSTYNLIRLKVKAEDIPPILLTSEVVTTVDYALTNIGGSEALLAQTGTMLLVRDSGEASFDRADFTHCHAYQAESTVDFDGAAGAAPAPSRNSPDAAQKPEKPLPAGLTVTIALTAPLTDRSAVGDLVEGKVVGNVAARKGAVLVPDGAPVHGRVRRLERSSDSRGFFAIGLEFSDIDVDGTTLRFFAELESAGPLAGLEMQMSGNPSGSAPALTPSVIFITGGGYFDPGSASQSVERVTQPDLPGVGSFFMRGEHFTLPAGFRTVWKTRAM